MPVQKVYLLNQTTPVNIPSGLVPKGVYAGGTSYSVGDSVSYNGSSYVCILASTGNLPTDTTYWQVLANKGDTGATGADSTVPGPAGADGADGADGLTVSVNSVTQVAGDISLTQDNIPDGTTNKAYTATEQTKLAGIETAADVTDATNVAAAGAVMDGDFSANGVMTRTAAGTYTNRTITGTANQITVTNGNGVSGNPTLSLPQDIHTGASPAFAGLTIDTTTLYVDATNNWVGLGTITPKSNLHIRTSGTSGLGAIPANRGMIISGIGGQSRWYYECTDATTGQRVFNIDNTAGLLSFGSLSDDASAWVKEKILSLSYDGTATHKGNVVPFSNSTYTLGTSSLYWKETYTDRLYLNSTAYLDGATAGVIGVTGGMASNYTGGVGYAQTRAGYTVGVGADGSGNFAATQGVNILIRSNTTGTVFGAGAATHTITLGNTATGIALYNTADQTTNYERLRLFTSGGTSYRLYAEQSGSGQAREIVISGLGISTQALALNVTSSNGFVESRGTSATANAIIHRISGTLSSTSGTQYGLSIIPTLGQSSTAGYTALLINTTETTTGSGTKLLADFQVGGVSKFKVDNTGKITSPLSQTYSITNITTDRAYDANATTLDEVADTLGTLIADLRSLGLVV